ncbi:FkbM family methyltransferase [Candidatus Jidaibacter acanthamoebae]|nr:FkbM family methyltransferase [Candidatus Jidaibacter acanthamoeba]
MKEKLKEILLSKKFQVAAVITLAIVLTAVITYLISYTSLTRHAKDVVLVETKYEFPLLVNSHDEYQGKALIEHGTYKEHLTPIIKKIVKNDGTCIDIGAGYGYHTVLMSKLAADGEVYSFEAIPNVYKLLRYSVNMNEIKNTKVFNNLLSSENTKSFLETYPEYPTLSSTIVSSKATHIKKDHYIEKNAEALDYLLPDLSDVSLIKIDTNGSELAIIKGAKGIISRSPKLNIILRWNYKKFAYYGDIYPRLIDNFVNAKFEFWIINQDGSMKLITKDQLLILENADVLITKDYIG